MFDAGEELGGREERGEVYEDRSRFEQSELVGFFGPREMRRDRDEDRVHERIGGRRDIEQAEVKEVIRDL